MAFLTVSFFFIGLILKKLAYSCLQQGLNTKLRLEAEVPRPRPYCCSHHSNKNTPIVCEKDQLEAAHLRNVLEDAVPGVLLGEGVNALVTAQRPDLKQSNANDLSLLFLTL